MLATDFLTSNLLKAADLDINLLIDAKIISVRPRDFEDGTTKLVVYTDYKAKGVVCNQTRLKALIGAFGPNPDNWVGKSIIIRQGTTMYAGEDAMAVVIEPVVAERIAAVGRPARDPSITVTSGRQAASVSRDEAPPIDHVPDGPGYHDDVDF